MHACCVCVEEAGRVHSADLPILQEVAGAKAVVWKLVQPHARTIVVVHIDFEVDQGQRSPHNADDLCVQGWITIQRPPVANSVFLKPSCARGIRP